MQTFYFTDPGKVRSHNEDSVTIVSNDKKEFVLHKEILLLSFVLYILCVFQVVTSQDINTVTGKLYIFIHN